MKKLQVLLLGTTLVGIHQAHALINDGKFGDPGELFIAVYDEAGQKSYYQDLGVDMAQFLSSQGCFVGHLGQDANYASFLGKPGLVYNIAAVNPLIKDAAGNPVNITTWGYLATSSQGGQVFNASWNAIDNTKQKIQSYIGALNVVPFTNAPGEASQNISGVFGPADPGYYGSTYWGSTIGHSVAGSTEGTPDQPLEFYFVNNSNGSDSGKQVSKLGTWTLSSAGELSYSGKGTTAVCAANSGNQAPNAVVANANQTVSVGDLVTLDGSGSNDPDNGPQPLAYAWKQISGPTVTLTNSDTATATFTPTQADTYVFQLTVTDGQTSSQASVTIVASAALPSGPYIRINAPNTWKVKQKEVVSWTTQQVDPKMKVKIQFSKNGGAKYKTLNSGVRAKKGGYRWKPKNSQVTQQGVLQLCVKPSKKIKTPVCDHMNIVVTQ